jgi:hypothetical protein
VAGEDVGQDLEDAPPVEQHVVEGPHHLHGPLGQPGQGHPHQRGPRQVQALRAVRGEQPAQRGGAAGVVEPGPVELPDRQREVPVHHLQRHRHLLPHHPAAQDGCAVDDLLPGGGEHAGVVDPVQDEADLLEVGGLDVLPTVGQPVEDHPGLHRRHG